MIMRIVTLSNNQPSWVDAGFNHYAKRFFKPWSLELVQIKPAARQSKNCDLTLLEDDGQKMLSKIPKNAWIVALDPKGTLFTTEQLSQEMQKWQNSGKLCLLIGGADGLAQNCKLAAHQHWSLSALTFPHGLVRVLLAEQLYRGWSLMHHHPYHRE